VIEDAEIAANPARLAEGWQRRFVTHGARAGEMVRLYEHLGYEVLAESIAPEQVAPHCADCRLVLLLQYQMIYTRPRPAAG
jgi:hypothetical protein